MNVFISYMLPLPSSKDKPHISQSNFTCGCRFVVLLWSTSLRCQSTTEGENQSYTVDAHPSPWWHSIWESSLKIL